MDSLAKNVVWMHKLIRLNKSLALLKPIEGSKMLCMKIKGSSQPCIWEEGRGYCIRRFEARLTRNFCECILYFFGEICGILENVPRFLKNAFHIPEERHLGLMRVK